MHKHLNVMRYVMVLAMGMAGLIACTDDVDTASDGGTLQLSITDVSTAVTTRSLPSELDQPVQSAFHLTVRNRDTGALVHDSAFASKIGPFAPAWYTVTASCGADTLGLDAPYYKGSTDAQVFANFRNEIEVLCQVANALMSVAYDEGSLEELDSRFLSYGVVVELDGEQVTMTGSAPAESAYFPAESDISVLFVGTNSSGNAVERDITSALADQLPLAAGEHLMVTLSVSSDRIDVTKVEVEQVTISETIPASWLPKPKTSASGFGDDGTLSFVETEQVDEADISFTASMGIQDIELGLMLEDMYFTQLNGTYTLSTMDAVQLETLAKAGITLPELGDTEGTVSLTTLVNMLRTNNGTPTENHIFLRVKANDRWSSDTSDEYVVSVDCPEFTLEVWPGNIWTKELTANRFSDSNVTAGDATVLDASMRYQYLASDGTTWTTFDDGNRLSGLTPGQTYTLRAWYREGIYSDSIQVSTFPLTELENGSLEEYEVEGSDPGSFGTASNYGALYSFTGWATLNPLTVDYCYAAAYEYNSYSGTRSTTESVSGNAVTLQTTSWGYGGTTYSPKYYSPAELFLGSLDNVDHDDDTADHNYGISYDSHPTHLSFYYKYTPYTSDGEGNDAAVIYVQVYSDDTLLGEAETTKGRIGSYTLEELEIEYDQDEEKLKLTPNKLVIFFSSGTSTDCERTTLSTFLTAITDCTWLGSKLWLDEISLLYNK